MSIRCTITNLTPGPLDVETAEGRRDVGAHETIVADLEPMLASRLVLSKRLDIERHDNPERVAAIEMATAMGIVFAENVRTVTLNALISDLLATPAPTGEPETAGATGAVGAPTGPAAPATP